MAVRFRPRHEPNDEELAYLNERNAPLRFERSLAGELVVSPPAGYATSLQNAELIGQLREWNRASGHGKVLESSAGISIGLNAAPDAAWLSGERARAIPPEARGRFLRIAPELVFELRSPSDSPAALGRKAAEWVAAGVKLAVALDPAARAATVYDKSGPGAPVAGGFCIESCLLPGASADLTLDLAAIFDEGL